MDALDVVAGDALLGADQVRAQVGAQGGGAAVHHAGEARVDKADQAVAAVAAAVDDVGGGDAVGGNDLGGHGGKVLVRHVRPC